MHTWSKLLTDALVVSAVAVAPAWAAPKDKLKVRPDTFVDTAGLFGPPVNPNAASSAWVNKSGTSSTETTFGNPADFGLVLTKNVITNVAAAGLASVEGPEGKTVTSETVFGYSYRLDGHCGAGAPRINVTVTDGTDQSTYNVGCGSSATPPTMSDSVNSFWTAVTWKPDRFIFLGNPDDPSNLIPLVELEGSQIVSMVIVFDEGTDQGVGEAILDDIRFNNLVAGGPAVAK